jgi:hypothetical protein
MNLNSDKLSLTIVGWLALMDLRCGEFVTDDPHTSV